MADHRFDRPQCRFRWAGGLAVGVHTTQFAIHDPRVGLYRPVLELASETARASEPDAILVAGLVGDTEQALREAEIALSLGYSCGLLSLSAFRGTGLDAILAHCERVAEAIPLFGFYLQPAVGGRVLPYAFWRRFCEIERVLAIKIAPFDRYKTLDVTRAVADSERGPGSRHEIALYTGNDDHIVLDLVIPLVARRGREDVTVRMRGGLLGHWSVWTRRAVGLFARVRRAVAEGTVDDAILALDARVTAMNAALFLQFFR